MSELYDSMCTIDNDLGFPTATLYWYKEAGVTSYDIEWIAGTGASVIYNVSFADAPYPWSAVMCYGQIGFNGYDYEFTGWFRIRASGGSWSSQIQLTNEYWPSAGSDSIPSYWPMVLDQWVWGAGDGPDVNGWQGQVGCCTANAVTTMMEALYRKHIGSVKFFSISWIHGNREADDVQGDGQWTSEALDSVVSSGALPYYDLPWAYRANNCTYNARTGGEYDPNYYYDYVDGGVTQMGTQTLVNNNRNTLGPIAARYKLSSWSSFRIHADTVQDIKNAITANGCVIFDLRVPNNFNIGGASCNGVPSMPDAYSGNPWHSMPIYGWKSIGGKLHWIGSPQLGDWWTGYQLSSTGKGCYFIPMDYPPLWSCYVASENLTYLLLI